MNSRDIKKKVTIIGAGYAGSSIAYALVLCNVANEIVLINRHIEKAQSEIDDIRHGFPFASAANLRIGDYKDCADSDVIIITVGRNRHVGESRLDLAKDNIEIVKTYVDKIKEYYINAVVLIVTNPIDIITQKVCEWINAPYGKIFGTGCILDSSRFIRVLADYFNVSITDIRAMIIGEHGDSQVPVWSQVLIKGKKVNDYCKENNIEWNDDIKNNISDRVKNMGASIIKQKGRTQYGIATCTADIVNAILTDKRITIPVSSPMQGECGINNVSISYPSIIGENGIENRTIIELANNEIDLLKISAKKVHNIV